MKREIECLNEQMFAEATSPKQTKEWDQYVSPVLDTFCMTNNIPSEVAKVLRPAVLTAIGILHKLKEVNSKVPPGFLLTFVDTNTELYTNKKILREAAQAMLCTNKKPINNIIERSWQNRFKPKTKTSPHHSIPASPIVKRNRHVNNKNA